MTRWIVGGMAMIAINAPMTAWRPCLAEAPAREGVPMRTDMLYSELGAFLTARSGEFGSIAPERRAVLDDLSREIALTRSTGDPVRMTFVCTHNSRRSHMAQLWAAAAAQAHGFTIETFSGGTETTAFNPRAVAAMRRAGFRIDTAVDGTNPRYQARLGEGMDPITCFSKLYDAPPNPTGGAGGAGGTGEQGGFIVIMVCDDADKSCPHVSGASARIALPYRDPKESDGSDREAAVYDERCAEIAREMLYCMSRVASR